MTNQRPSVGDVERRGRRGTGVPCDRVPGAHRRRQGRRQVPVGGTQRAAERLGYVPNRAARSLRTRRSGSIGVVLAEPSAVVFGNPFFGQLLSGIAQELNERDLQLTLFLPQNERDERRLQSYLASGHVDGVLLTFYQDRDPIYDQLARNGIPVVVNARPLYGSSPVSYVDADNDGGAALAVEHLLEQGCRSDRHDRRPAGHLGRRGAAHRLPAGAGTGRDTSRRGPDPGRRLHHPLRPRADHRAPHRAPRRGRDLHRR